MVHILPSVTVDRITLPDIIDDAIKAPSEGINSDAKSSETEVEDNAEKSDTESESKLEKEEEPEEPKEEDVKYAWNAPCMMVIFEDGDLDCALYHLVESLQDPFALDAVGVILVQEALVEEIEKRVQILMKPLDARVANHPCYKRTLLRIGELKPKTVIGPPDRVLPDATPMLVRDIPHKYIGDGPTGIITMHIFRTPFEATQIYRKEYPLPIASVSIWNERVSSVYDVIANMNSLDTFKVNCFTVDMEPIKRAFEQRKYSACMHRGYHYETLPINGERKIIIYPVGTIFGN
uniref:GG12073 n=2 Tax=Drosophila erecta TaxID=7220 RepID=B3P5T8_DROER